MSDTVETIIIKSTKEKIKKLLHQELINLYTDTSPIRQISFTAYPLRNIVTLAKDHNSFELYQKIILEIDNECEIVKI